MMEEVIDACNTQLTDLQANLQVCREQGLDRVDPLGFYYLSALVQRAENRSRHASALRQRLLGKAASLLNEFRQSCEQKKQSLEESSKADENLSSLTTLKALNQLLQKRSAQDQNVTDKVSQTSDELTRKPGTSGSHQPELQAVKHYQQMFEKMAVERLLNKVMQEIPENAGPLNPERMVIRCLSALQDISPAYAMRLISYYESLICLQSLPLQDR